MKTIITILSFAVFLGAGYYFITDLEYATEMNYLIYMTLLVILMMICIIGIVATLPLLVKQKRKMKTMMYNSYSQKRIKNSSFDREFSFYKN